MLYLNTLCFVIAISGSVIAIVGVMMALFLWNRGESNSDRRDIVNLIIAIKEGIKDSHERLIKIEEKRK